MDCELIDYGALTGKYRFLAMEEILKIKAKWTVNENIQKLLDVSLHPSFSAYDMVWFNTTELITKVDFVGLDPNVLFTGDDASDYRIAKILDDWRNQKFADPPTICMDDNNQLTITDGRHRTIVAYHLKEIQIPVAVHKSMKKLISSFIDFINI